MLFWSSKDSISYFNMGEAYVNDPASFFQEMFLSRKWQ